MEIQNKKNITSIQATNIRWTTGKQSDGCHKIHVTNTDVHPQSTAHENYTQVIYSYFAHNFNKLGCLVFKPTALFQRCDNSRCWQSPECRADRDLHADSNVIEQLTTRKKTEKGVGVGGDRNSIKKQTRTQRKTRRQSGAIYWSCKRVSYTSITSGIF